MVKDKLYECIECNGTFDAQHIEAKYEFDLCVFCEAECYNFHFNVDSMSESESDDPDYVPSTEPESEDYQTDSSGDEDETIQEMQVICVGDVCKLLPK